MRVFLKFVCPMDFGNSVQALFSSDSHPRLPVILKSDFFSSASFCLVLAHTV